MDNHKLERWNRYGLCMYCGVWLAVPEYCICVCCMSSNTRKKIASRKPQLDPIVLPPRRTRAPIAPVPKDHPVYYKPTIYVVASTLRGIIDPPEPLDRLHEEQVLDLWRAREEAQKPFRPVRIPGILYRREAVC